VTLVGLVAVNACSAKAQKKAGADAGADAGEDEPASADSSEDPATTEPATPTDAGVTDAAVTVSAEAVPFGIVRTGVAKGADTSAFVTNSCSGTEPYPSVSAAWTNRFVALDPGSYGDNWAAECGACVIVSRVSNPAIRTIVRVSGQSVEGTNNIAVSREAASDLQLNPYGESVNWQFAKCPALAAPNQNIWIQVSTEQSNLEFWIRNARLPIEAVSVNSQPLERLVGVGRYRLPNNITAPFAFTLTPKAGSGSPLSFTIQGPTLTRGQSYEVQAQFP